MDILYSGNVDGFCIVSSDSDFTRLAARLRESGMQVIGMGEEKTPKPFISACNQFKYLDLLYSNQQKEEKEEKVVYTPQDYFISEAEGVEKVWIIPNSQDHEMEPVILILNEGATGGVRVPFEGEEIGYVLEGRVRIETDKGVYKARRGESFYINGKRQHEIVNIHKGRSKILWITTPSNF